MSDEALVFGARKLVEALNRRHSCRCETDKIIKWAKNCASENASLSSDPGWWISSAIADFECLDACYAMIRNL
jgi:hypothetical protein